MQEFLRNYRSTPHPTTGISPSELMFGKNRTNRLPAIVDDSKSREEYKKIATANDKISKEKSKLYNDKKYRAKEHNFKEKDEVLVRQKRLNKWMTRFSAETHKVTNVNGRMISVEASESGKEFARNASKFRPLKKSVLIASTPSPVNDQLTMTSAPTSAMVLPPATSPEAPKPSQRQSSRTTKKPDRLGIDPTNSVIEDHQQEEEGEDDIASNYT